MSRDVIYLDANATTPPDLRIWDVMRETAETAYANPGSSHQQGRRARMSLENSRETISQILGGSPQELIFTSGATESINLALQGLAEAIPAEKRVLALTGGEHPAVSETAQRLKRRGWELITIPLTTQGELDQTILPALPWEKIGLVSVIYANNETGVIQNLNDLRKLCEKHQIPWHLDAVQAVGRIPLNVQALGATAVSFCVHKCHGPRGIGGLFLKEGVPFVPAMSGGFQEASRRPGTEPTVLASGMAETLRIFQTEAQQAWQNLEPLRNQFEQSLLQQAAPAIINGLGAKRLPNTSNITFPGVEGEALLVNLDLERICCSLGSACASGSVEPSPVLLAMGIDPTTAKSSLRFSLHRFHQPEQIEAASEKIAQVVKRLRNLHSEDRSDQNF